MRRVPELVFSVFVAALVGCQQLGGPAPMTPVAREGMGASQAALDGLKTPIRAQDMIVRGKVEFATRAVQATSNDVISVATVNMVDPGNSNTLGTATTDSSGNFSLTPNADFSPKPDVYYLLDAVKGLGTNAPGKPTVRLRTLLTWDMANGGWKSITNGTSTAQGGTLTIRSVTTAVALLSAFDGSKVPSSATIGKVVDSGGWKLADNAFEPNFSNAFVNALDAQIGKYLAADLDPVAVINGLAPVISGIDVQQAAEGGTFVVNGTGFSPVPADNYLAWNKTQAVAGASLVNPIQASSTRLWFKLPAMAQSGAGFAAIIMNNQLSNWQSLTIEAKQAEVQGISPIIETITPGNGKPGDEVTLQGKNFDATPLNDIIYFGTLRVSPMTASATELKVRVPDGARSDGVYIQTPTGQSNKVYFAVFADQQLTESFGNSTYRDSANTTAVGWPGSVIEAMGSGEAGSGVDGALTVTGGGTVINTVRTYITAAANAGQDKVTVQNPAGLTANREILLVVTQNSATPNNVGLFEFATISSVSGSQLTLSSNLVNSYNTNLTQVILVKHYTTVVVNGGASIVAPTWDGNTGGIVAFRAQASITNNGTIAANGTGYRGGTSWSSWYGWNCAWCGGTGGWTGSWRRGEGRNRDWATNSHGAYEPSANLEAGGGARAMYAGYRGTWHTLAGGGGGGHTSAGGAGTWVWNYICCSGARFTTGGAAGAAYGAADLTRLNFGGSGGSSYWSDGGAGGGIVFMAAPYITNSGNVQALGGGGAGGGAGGTIYVRSAALIAGGGWHAYGAGGGSYSGGGGTGRTKFVYYTLDRALGSVSANPAVGFTAAYNDFSASSVVQSKGYDTGNPRPFYTGYAATEALNGQRISYLFADSADNANWGAWASDITTLKARYIRWKATLLTADSTITPSLSQVVVKYKVAQ